MGLFWLSVAIAAAIVFFKWLVNAEIVHSPDMRSRSQVGFDMQYALDALEAAVYSGAFSVRGWEVPETYPDLMEQAFERISYFDAFRVVREAGYLTKDEIDEFRGALGIRTDYYARQNPSTRALKYAEGVFLFLAATVRDRIPAATPPVIKPEMPRPL